MPVDYREVAAEWVAQSHGGEGLDPEDVHVVYEHCQYLDKARPAGEGTPVEFLRRVWRDNAKKFDETGRGDYAAWMVEVEALAARV